MKYIFVTLHGDFFYEVSQKSKEITMLELNLIAFKKPFQEL